MVIQGRTHEISVDINADADLPYDHLHFFIDWNQNGVLDDEGEVYVLSDATGVSGIYSMNVTVPEDAELGITRMRVMILWRALPAITPNPCDTNFSYGEVEDYSIEVMPDMADVNDFSSSNGISIYKSGSETIIEAKNAPISEIQVFDLTGKLISTQTQLNHSKMNLDLKLKNRQIIVLKVTTKDGKTVSKKVVY